TDEPDDFAAFWRDTFEEAMAHPLDWTMEAAPARSTGAVDIFDVEFAGMLGNRVGGWLVKPSGIAVARGAIGSHGYGGRAEPDLNAPFPPDTAIFCPVC